MVLASRSGQGASGEVLQSLWIGADYVPLHYGCTRGCCSVVGDLASAQMQLCWLVRRGRHWQSQSWSCYESVAVAWFGSVVVRQSS
jgi:hypothetical protein